MVLTTPSCCLQTPRWVQQSSVRAEGDKKWRKNMEGSMFIFIVESAGSKWLVIQGFLFVFFLIRIWIPLDSVSLSLSLSLQWQLKSFKYAAENRWTAQKKKVESRLDLCRCLVFSPGICWRQSVLFLLATLSEKTTMQIWIVEETIWHFQWSTNSIFPVEIPQKAETRPILDESVLDLLWDPFRCLWWYPFMAFQHVPHAPETSLVNN